MKLGCFHSSLTTNNSKWIRDLNVRPGTLKLLEKNVEKTLQDTGIGKDFLSRILLTWEIRSTSDLMNKRQPTEWEKNVAATHLIES